MLTASVSYLAHSPLLPDKQRGQAESLYERMRRHVSPGQTPWLSLTGYELEPHCFSVVKRAISTESLLDMEYTDGAGRTRRRTHSTTGSTRPRRRHHPQQQNRQLTSRGNSRRRESEIRSQ